MRFFRRARKAHLRQYRSMTSGQLSQWRGGPSFLATPVPELTAEENQLLAEVGLPHAVGPSLEPTFMSAALERGVATLSLGTRRFLQIGEDGGTAICLDAANRSVVSVDPEGEYPERFVNSTLVSLVQCLRAYDDWMVQDWGDSDGDIERACRVLRDQVTHVDPDATASDESWWPCVIESLQI